MTREIKILCVDDEPNVLSSVHRLFLDEEYELLTALSGQGGLDLLEREETVQVVVADFRMPGMNGVDFLKEVSLRWPRTVRLVLSGYADIAAVVSAINEGKIYKFIPKPWNDEELKLAVSQAVHLHGLQQERFALVDKLTAANEELTLNNENYDRLISEQKQAFAAQAKELREVQGIMERLSHPVVALGAGGVIRLCNSSCRELCGVGEESGAGRPAGAVLPGALLTLVDSMKTGGRAERLHLMGREWEVSGAPFSCDPAGEEIWVYEFWPLGDGIEP